ncbi:hypothetical protein B7486_55960, partial [cyanobacterium TDX16]
SEGPSLEPVFGPLEASFDRTLRNRVLAAQRAMTDWVLTTSDRPAWRLGGFHLVVVEGQPPALLQAHLDAGEARRAVHVLLAVWSPPRAGSWNIDLTVRTDCRCGDEHWDPHLVASHQLDARSPEAAVDRLEQMASFAVEHLPNHSTEQWIAKGEDPATANTSWSPMHARQAERSSPWSDDRQSGDGAPTPRWPL